MDIAFVCIMGIGTVFVGLICLIVISNIMSAVCKMFAKPEKEAAKPAPAKASAQTPANAGAPIQNKQEIVAGVCAVIAEELGTDVSNIKVTSFKRV